MTSTVVYEGNCYTSSLVTRPSIKTLVVLVLGTLCLPLAICAILPGHKPLVHQTGCVVCDSVKVPRLYSAVLTASYSYGATAIHSLCLLLFSFIRGIVPALQRDFPVVTITNFPDTDFAMAAPKRVTIRAPSKPACSPRRKSDELFTKMTVSEVMQVHRRLLCAELLSPIDSGISR